MRIEQVLEDKKRFLPLLLLGDEQESMIDHYLNHGNLFVGFTAEERPIAVAVVTEEIDGVLELKNLAIDKAFQRQGLGSWMIEYICDQYRPQYHTLFVGTGDSERIVSFYRKNGFRYSHTVADFFIKNYDHPIVEEGKQLRDMLYFKRMV